MEDEFERIMEFFNLSPEEKEARLKEVFEDSVEYFERFKYIMSNGTPEEKKRAVERIKILKKKIDEETRRVCEKTGMTPQQLTSYSTDRKNFTAEQWDAIESARKRLDDGTKELRKSAGGEEKPPNKGPEDDGPPKKKRKKPKNWIPS